MKKCILSTLLILIFFIPRQVYAGGAMIQKRKAQQQIIIQKQIQLKQTEQLKLRAQQQARQKASQAVYEHQKQEIQKALVEKALIERQVAVAQKQAAQQAVMAQQYTMQQAAIAQQAAMAQQRAVQQVVIQQKAGQELAAQKALQAKMYEILEQDNAGVEDIVTLDELVASLDQSAQAWPLIIDAEAKQIVVARYIQRFKERGININNSSLYYVCLIDDLSKDAPQMLEQSFEDILQVVAVIEYDFDNGQDKDAMARQLFGPEEFRRNKERLLSR